MTVSSAGPIANLRTEKGATVRCEVHFVDENFYYCQRIAEPKEAVTIPVENIPRSFRQHVDGLRKKGELGPPPSGVGARAPSEPRPSSWDFVDNNTPGDPYFGKYLSTKGRSNKGFTPNLYFRYRRNKYEAYIQTGYKVTFVNDWEVTYVIDNKAPVTERFTMDSVGRTFFVPHPFHFRDQLKGGTNLLITFTDFKKNKVQMLFDIRGFEDAIEQIDSTLELSK